MFEKRWRAVPPQLFTSSGTVYGNFTVADASLFRVKQKVVITATSLTTLELEVKAIQEDGITISVGPCKGSISQRTDISAYTTLLISAIHAQEQPRSVVPEQEIERLTYQEEPSVARRVLLVDNLGRPYTILPDNPLPVTVADNGNRLTVNPDGSINVNASIGVSGTANPIIVNIPTPLAGTEYSTTMPKTTKRFLFRMRNASKCQVAFVSGGTTTNYITMNSGVCYGESELSLAAPLTIYFNSFKPAEVAEILYWT